MRHITSHRHVLILAALAGLAICSVAATAQEPKPTLPEPLSPLGRTQISDYRKADLGEMLFSDPILSGEGKLSCASCHSLSQGGTVRIARTIGYKGRMHRFNSPTIFNVAQNYRLGWRGNFTKLEDQNEAVLLDPNLMASDWPRVIASLGGSPRYADRFKDIYGRSVRKSDVLDALAQFQRALGTPNAKFDRYLLGDRSQLSQREANGYALFKSYGCASCHQGRNVGGNLFERFGIFGDPNTAEFLGDNVVDEGDLGRLTVTHAAEDRGVFRVPSLRNVEVTAPYFHDGRTSSLEDAVSIMAKLQLGHEMPENDVADVTAFLRTLTGEFRGRKLSNEP
jgi:cytochrome c peroxidase